MIDLSEMDAKPGHLIRLVHQRMNAIFSEATIEFDVTPTQHLVLWVLQRYGNIDLTTLSALTTTDRATIGDVVKRMSQKGFVTVRPTPADRRVKEISLTRPGSKLLAKSAESMVYARNVLMSPLDEEEQEGLMRLLRKLIGRASPSVASQRREIVAGADRRVLLSGIGNPVGSALSLRLSDKGADVVDLDGQANTAGFGRRSEQGSTGDIIVVSQVWPIQREHGEGPEADLQSLLAAVQRVERLWDERHEKCPAVLSLLVGRADGRVPPEFASGVRALWFRAVEELSQRSGEGRVHAAISGVAAIDQRPSPLEWGAAVTQAVDLASLAVEASSRFVSTARFDLLDN